MEQWIKTFFDKYIEDIYFPTVGLTDIIEILIIAVIVYEIMLWIKNTKAWMLLKGMIMLGAFILFAAVFQMHTILFLARESINVLAIAAVVVFQPELRRALEKLGEKNLLSNFFRVKNCAFNWAGYANIYIKIPFVTGRLFAMRFVRCLVLCTDCHRGCWSTPKLRLTAF